MNASNEEIPPEAEPQTEESFSETLKSLRKYFAEQAAEWREGERHITPLQQEHIDRLRSYRIRLTDAAEAYFQKQATADEEKSEDQPMSDEQNVRE